MHVGGLEGEVGKMVAKPLITINFSLQYMTALLELFGIT